LELYGLFLNGVLGFLEDPIFFEERFKVLDLFINEY